MPHTRLKFNLPAKRKTPRPGHRFPAVGAGTFSRGLAVAVMVLASSPGCLLAAPPAPPPSADALPLRILSFKAEHGHEHASKPDAVRLLERLGQKNGWEVVATDNPASLTRLDLNTFATVIFNNNCGNRGQIMNPQQQEALQRYVQNGGGFLAVHCAGAIWNEGDPFRSRYEGLVGARMVDHPPVQRARLVVADRDHPATRHPEAEWFVTDEFHRFASNPRTNVHVLISEDEDSYEGKQKMGGDHPFVWYHAYAGGRAFFTSLGHTPEIYRNPDFEQLVEGAILWTSGEPDAEAEAKPEATDAPARSHLTDPSPAS